MASNQRSAKLKTLNYLLLVAAMLLAVACAQPAPESALEAPVAEPAQRTEPLTQEDFEGGDTGNLLLGSEGDAEEDGDSPDEEP